MAVVALEVQNLTFSYRARVSVPSSTRLIGILKATTDLNPALRDVSFSVECGEIFGLLGPNGGGKTTLFRILSTYYAPSSGSARIFDFDIVRDGPDVRLSIGVVFQSPSLDKKLTIFENLVHQGHLYGMSGKTLESRIAELLRRIGLYHRASELVETLSGGLQRRVEIAKGMIHSPKLLLMDEPSSGLDPGVRRDLWDYLSDLKKEGMTILITTHLMEEAEKCDRLAILNEGQLVALGTPATLKDEIGGDVITVETKNPAALSDQFQKKFGLQSIVLDNAVRIEKERGHEFVPTLVQSFAGEILSVTVGKPTLEDVFIHRTGHKFWNRGKDES